MSATLVIENNGVPYIPILAEGVKWTTERTGTAGKLTFEIHKDSKINFTEGNPVKFYWDNKPIFFGFVFSKSRSKDDIISVTAYDQLRYLKNKDTMVFENKTATEIIKEIANKFSLKTGALTNSNYKIESLTEDNKTLFDMINDALNYTVTNTKNMFIFYDDFGKLTLKNLSEMKTDFLLNESSGENYSYKSSIDGETYNTIKLIYEDKNSSERKVYIAKDSSNINTWGILQYYATIQEGENGKEKADALLKYYNVKSRTLTFSNVFGRTDVRAGSLIVLDFNVGDVIFKNYMLVEKCTHTFNNGVHLMDLTLKGNVING